jgi:hypothetical protein
MSSSWLFCFGLTMVGAIGLTSHELNSRIGRVPHKNIEVPFGSLLSLAEEAGGLGLAYYWFGVSASVIIFISGSICAFALTFAFGARFQFVWFVGQLTFILWGAMHLI